jgi:hypothetical protein
MWKQIPHTDQAVDLYWEIWESMTFRVGFSVLLKEGLNHGRGDGFEFQNAVGLIKLRPGQRIFFMALKISR